MIWPNLQGNQNLWQEDIDIVKVKIYTLDHHIIFVFLPLKSVSYNLD